MATNVSQDNAARIAEVRGYIIDMDGVLYRGDTVLPHVSEFLSALESRLIPYIMATNNSTKTPQEYVEKLASMDLDVPVEKIMTSGVATSVWLKERYPRGTRTYVVGMDALHEAIYGDGYFVPAEIDADLVVSGGDFSLTYDKLRIATLAIRNGAAYVATNGDRTFPTEYGIIPGSGAIISAIAAATDVMPEVIGKPAPGMLIEGAHLIGTKPSETAMLGDRLDTDILAGERAGLITVLVMTGVTDEAELATSEITPDVVFPDLQPLVELYRES